MIFRIIMLVCTLGITSCSTTQVKSISAPIEGSKFGISYTLDYETKLCHQHVGFTVFNNFNNEYSLNADLSKVVISGYMKGIEATGSSAVEIAHMPDLHDHTTVSFWNATPTLNSDGIKLLSELRNTYGIEFLIYPRSYRKKSEEYKDQCWGITLKTGGNNSVPFYPLYSAWVFNTKTGAYIGETFIKNNTFEVTLPSNNNNITEYEIQYYVSMAAKYASKGIQKLIENSR